MHNYNKGDILTFSNGLIGCVTDNYRLALVNHAGWTTRPHSMPSLDNYLQNHTVVAVEHAVVHDRFDIAA